eukprot:CAMPEP_0201282212 /NCGR_PEP_ID=MMETSP1317-20130820/5065_1 /ASSEMBLY_ACC=CAM_ASM_000770 /TAXON_ID=187299 /ORGANISM="Undescribed Undescribed, Strain Undescribed" /LENGTH=137 /DNA_ID=CAMNT_0047594239 /DNA_START=282 /DNA_END=695 /DNA_ORIENTATION=-
MTEGSFSDALILFERALIRTAGYDEHNMQCLAGIARNSIRMGDVQQGFSKAKELKDPQMKLECAYVCESMKQWAEAAMLYEAAGLLEKAAALYIKLRQYNKASPIIGSNTPGLQIQLAKAKEAEACYKEAENHFEKA